MAKGQSFDQVKESEKARIESAIEEKKELQAEKDLSAKMYQKSAKLGGFAQGGIGLMFGDEQSDARQAIEGVTTGATMAMQAMAALPGSAGMAAAAMIGLGSLGAAAIDFVDGVVDMRKMAEINKAKFQELSSALTEYSQTLGQLTDAYGDPTVTTRTIDALNKKLMDTLNAIPDTEEGRKIKSELAATADPQQRQQLIAQAQDTI